MIPKLNVRQVRDAAKQKASYVHEYRNIDFQKGVWDFCMKPRVITAKDYEMVKGLTDINEPSTPYGARASWPADQTSNDS